MMTNSPVSTARRQMPPRLACALLTLIAGPAALAAQTPVAFAAPDGLTITAEVYTPDLPPRATLLLFHQSGSSRGEFRQIAPRLVAAGFEAIAVDLRWGGTHRASGVVNETARRHGTDSIMALANAGDRRLVWPTIFAAHDDLLAAIDWARDRPNSGPLVVVGSSFSAMLALKAANDSPLAGMVAYSPGEYFGEDSTLARRWAGGVRVPAHLVAAPGEEAMVETVLDAIPPTVRSYHVTDGGRHAASVLDADSLAMEDLLQRLDRWFPMPPTPGRVVTLVASDGVAVHATWYPPALDADDAPVVLMMHQGGSSAVAEQVRTLPRILATGAGALLLDLRGGGDLFGGRNRTTAGSGRDWGYCEALPDLRAATGWLRTEERRRRLILLGSSYTATLALVHAAETASGVDAVVALSPAGGEPMEGCHAEAVSDGLRIPVLIGRPSRELEIPSVAEQFATFAAQGHDTVTVVGGAHGASMLDRLRHSGDTERMWALLLTLLRGDAP